MKRILFVDHASRILGGAEINLIELLAELAREPRWALTCARSPGSPLAEALRPLEVSVADYSAPEIINTLRVVGRRLPLRRAWQARKAMHTAVSALEEIVCVTDPNVIVSCTNKDHYAVSLLNEQRRFRGPIPSVWWFNDILSARFFSLPFRLAFVWRALRSSRKIIAVSNYARRSLLWYGLPASRVVTIHNGLPMADYQVFDRKHAWRPPNVAADEPLIGLIARFTPWKGQEFFIKLASRWICENPRGHFLLVGQAFNEDAVFETGLRAAVSQAGLQSRVHFVPFQKNIIPVLSSLSVLVHASLRPEPFGRVIVEAMAAGVPVLAARAGGVPEIIVDNINGLLAKPGDLQAYCTQLHRLLNDHSLARRLRQAAWETVREHFEIGRVRQQFDAIIEELT